MARIRVQNCGCLDFPCCGCGSSEVLTGNDALEAIREQEEATYAEPDFCNDVPDEVFEPEDGDALASAGFGTDEAYDFDTPMGEDFGGE